MPRRPGDDSISIFQHSHSSHSSTSQTQAPRPRTSASATNIVNFAPPPAARRPVLSAPGGTQVKWNRQDPHVLASSHAGEVLI
ncbi:hypothetical protein B0H17DRAFT_1211469 [Mycena rosella]|uniref:Uncharacterized protein n=1 Tax=Mycena rosella TaxID=1033263 RepID=A0AAD7G7Q8_MYCRO|nr:hypothetical protein B0H17DRAFT_1211469 [Mycena rosella]